MVRKGGTNVDVEFNVQENGIAVPSGDAAKVFNYLSESGLQKRLGYNVCTEFCCLLRGGSQIKKCALNAREEGRYIF